MEWPADPVLYAAGQPGDFDLLAFSYHPSKVLGKNWFGKLWLPPTLTLDWYKWAIDTARLPRS